MGGDGNAAEPSTVVSAMLLPSCKGGTASRPRPGRARGVDVVRRGEGVAGAVGGVAPFTTAVAAAEEVVAVPSSPPSEAPTYPADDAAADDRTSWDGKWGGVARGAPAAAAGTIGRAAGDTNGEASPAEEATGESCVAYVGSWCWANITSGMLCPAMTSVSTCCTVARQAA